MEFWFNEEYQWCAATVKRKVRGSGGELLHTLEFDIDGTWEDVKLERWRVRPLPPGR